MVWKEIPDFPGYEISDVGVVRSWRRSGGGFGKRRKSPLYKRIGVWGSGYKFVGLRKEGKSYACSIHRLVLITFVGPCPEGKEGRHMDGDKSNNSYLNLQWGTTWENHQDKIRHGTSGLGELSERALFTNLQVEEILMLLQEDKLNHPTIGKMYGVDCNIISQIKRNICYTNVLPEIREKIKKIRPDFQRKSIGHSGKKLSPEKVQEIKYLINLDVKIKRIAKHYDVDYNTINHIKRGITWKEVPCMIL